MLLFPNCKINIGLRVVRKREDGYHDLETVFYPVHGLHDELEVEPAETFAFEQEGIAVDCPAEKNLIVRCYRQMQAKYPRIGEARIRFRKNIPFGAGLGGGSSDAAHTAIALNELFGLELSKEELAQEVCTLGADCPFFIYNVPCFAEGIGNKLTPIDFLLDGLRLVLIKPDCGVSTREAYNGLRLAPDAEGLPKEILAAHGDSAKEYFLSGKGSALVNDFEQSVFPLHPEIGRIKQRLLDAGAIYASMSGSGSTVFGLFEDDAEGRTAAQLRLLHEEFAAMVLLDDTL